MKAERGQKIKVHFYEPFWIKNARHSRGYTQAKAAEKAGISQAMISAIEHGRVICTTEQAQALADAYDYPIGHFKEPPPKNQSMKPWFTKTEISGPIRIKQHIYDKLIEMARQARFRTLEEYIQDVIEKHAKAGEELNFEP